MARSQNFMTWSQNVMARSQKVVKFRDLYTRQEEKAEYLGK